jgi:hypothetical protein
MTLYECEKCNKEFNKKSSYIYHTEKRKKSCVSDKKYICNNCNTAFSFQSGLSRHMNNICGTIKNNNKLEVLKKEVDDVKKILLDLKKNNDIIKTTNIQNTNTNNTNNTNNIIQNNVNIIIPFGKEDFEDIDNETILKALNAGSKSIHKLTESIYIGEKFPHYHNLYISDLNRNLINCYDGNNKWITKTKDMIMENLYDTNLRMLRYTYEENDTYKKKYKSFREFLISQEEMSDNELENEEEKIIYKNIYDKKIRGKVISELELLLYNKK